ncbi:MAG: thioredoxin domain-containing protein [Clostridia bacterium]|nr:thioredoxin domain-containing protein [Clostridia bacterium]
MPNHLIHETSPYLKAHAENPVDWYPWGEAALSRAKELDRPILLSIGYSTCHWCHVMAEESFESEEAAEILNRSFVSIKVDREERPDLDAVYMAACQALTGSGGWPTTLFLTPEGEAFFAGTYFPLHGRQGQIGFVELLERIEWLWQENRDQLLTAAEELTAWLNRPADHPPLKEDETAALPHRAFDELHRRYDTTFGGFGGAPKFPMPPVLLFLLDYAETAVEPQAASMACHTLEQMARGGLFDHMGGGFCRYSTDRRFLIPHFEKMLYDNAQLLSCYALAYERTQKPFFLDTARRTADWLYTEMQSPEGGFYSAQDADSEGGEGAYYLFDRAELLDLLGDQAAPFLDHYDIRPGGNFEGKSHPNLLSSGEEEPCPDYRRRVYDYRRTRMSLATDTKLLTAWNALLAVGLCHLWRVGGDPRDLQAAKEIVACIERLLTGEDGLYASWCAGKRGQPAFLDDYACMALALLTLYENTQQRPYLDRAAETAEQAAALFEDWQQGGSYQTAAGSERLLVRTMETYDGATPSGNAVMALVLTRLSQLLQEDRDRADRFEEMADRQLTFLAARAAEQPSACCTFLQALLLRESPPPSITLASSGREGAETFLHACPLRSTPRFLAQPTEEYPLLDGESAWYVCLGQTCLPPQKDLATALAAGRKKPIRRN